MDVALNPGPNLSSAQFVANTMNASLSDDKYGDADPVMNFGLPSNGLKIMHLNVRSLRNKVELIAPATTEYRATFGGLSLSAARLLGSGFSALRTR